jgi:hypothetical protein
MIEITFPILVAVTVGITEVLKRIIGDIPLSPRITPLIALVMGVALSLGAYEVNFNTVFTGLIVGLSASGLFSGVKSVIKG